MNHAQTFDELRRTGTDGEDAYLTILTARSFEPAIACCENGTGVRWTLEDEFLISTFDDIVAVG